MQTVVRRYTGEGSTELFEVLAKRTGEIEELMRSVKGFVGYTLASSAEGGFSVTVCQDKAGIDQSVQLAREWIAKNAGSTKVAPQVTEGLVLLHLK